MRLIDADKLKKHYAWWGNDGEDKSHPFAESVIMGMRNEVVK